MTDTIESDPSPRIRKIPRLSHASQPSSLSSPLPRASILIEDSAKSRKRRQNRESEARARVRRKAKEDRLRKRVEELTDENGRLGKEAERLRAESAAILQNLRFYQTFFATQPTISQPSL
jgi:hypothetical protein